MRRLQAQRANKRAKTALWCSYCASINPDVPLQTIWRRVQRMNGSKERGRTVPALFSNNETLCLNRTKASTLGAHFFNPTGDANINPELKAHKRKFANLHQAIIYDTSPVSFTLNLDFSLRELKEAISESKNRAPGLDQLTYNMFKHMDDRVLGVFLELLNNAWSWGKLPHNWKHSVVIPIHKVGKDPSNPCSYRPIALISVVSKLMEKMVNERLIFFSENNNLLCKYQTGFRKRRSTIDHIASLANDIRRR